jgi:hypothetical protein
MDMEELDRLGDRVKHAITTEREIRARQMILDKIKERGRS